ncbi:MAG: TetR/AcrR family transcriptional regulator [Sporichthyaceae bacterium]
MSPEPKAGEGAFRQEILDAIALMLRESSLDAIRITDILRASRVARGTFYFYYASKEDAFAALLDQVYARLVPGFEQMFADPSARRPQTLQKALEEWLTFSDAEAAVVRTAIEEWPRNEAIREVHLAAQRRMSAALKKALDAERREGAAPAGIASATLASALVWTMERAWYEALAASRAGTEADVAAVTDALAATIAAALHGRT